MKENNTANSLINSREFMRPEGGFQFPAEQPGEGGCGVIGMASSEAIPAKHMLAALMQMRNRGNGKGGGIAATGLDAKQFGVSQEILESHYLIAIAYLDISVRKELEEKFIFTEMNVHHTHELSQIDDFRDINELEVRPPEVVLYFARPKADVLEKFIEEKGLQNLSSRMAEDEWVYQNSFKLNTTYYESVGEKQAFVLSHAKNLLVLKMVGYGDDVIIYYKLEDINAHVWIGHHRYPTKGRVWHPGGAHPFIGMNEALVHNGDFANHAAITEYLSQRNIYPLYLTDTEVAVQVFDLLHRTYQYPLEYVIEAMAPTTERDFKHLPIEKQRIYKMIQTTHIASSPDGPWFFLIAQSDTHADDGPEYRLTGITDTSMLRPQVFAYQEHTREDGKKIAIALAASEKQGIDATLKSLAKNDHRFWPRADRYWNARGGSHTDGGAFLFTVKPDPLGGMQLISQDKFGHTVLAPTSTVPYSDETSNGALEMALKNSKSASKWAMKKMRTWQYADVISLIETLEKSDDMTLWLDTITILLDRRYDTGKMRRSSLLTLFDASLDRWLVAATKNTPPNMLLHKAGDRLPKEVSNRTIVIDCLNFTPQDETSLARELQRFNQLGAKRFILLNNRGHRFIGSGFGVDSTGVRIDAYGSPGDYLASGLDGAEIHVHTNGQDQLAQIMKAGKLVVHGDVGQTFMYGAKGGEAYILGNAAGRPLINAVGKPRVVINGTCLDYLAESFMAGDPLDGGGFVVLNGITFDEANCITFLETPYPGGNLFSLASGGAIYVRDPRKEVTADQLNGGKFVPLSDADWALIEPYLLENERLFDIPVNRLLTVEGVQLHPSDVYRKIEPRKTRALRAEEAWVTG
jgi:glutamate synthase domain-containing protein 1/glutamate synthase domain-containing protein 3